MHITFTSEAVRLYSVLIRTIRCYHSYDVISNNAARTIEYAGLYQLKSKVNSLLTSWNLSNLFRISINPSFIKFNYLRWKMLCSLESILHLFGSLYRLALPNHVNIDCVGVNETNFAFQIYDQKLQTDFLCAYPTIYTYTIPFERNILSVFIRDYYSINKTQPHRA